MLSPSEHDTLNKLQTERWESMIRCTVRKSCERNVTSKILSDFASNKQYEISSRIKLNGLSLFEPAYGWIERVPCSGASGLWSVDQWRRGETVTRKLECAPLFTCLSFCVMHSSESIVPLAHTLIWFGRHLSEWTKSCCEIGALYVQCTLHSTIYCFDRKKFG